MTGQTMLTAESAFVFTSLDMKIVSVMVYSPMKSMVAIVGKAKRSRGISVKSCARGFPGVLGRVIGIASCLFRKYKPLRRIAEFCQ